MIWTLILVVALATFVLRLSFFVLEGRLGLPPLVREALTLLPAAVLPALILPGVVTVDGVLDLSPWGNPRIVAALAAVVTAWRTGSMVATIVAGAGVLLLLGG